MPGREAVQISGKMPPGFSTILPKEALELISDFAREFGPRRASVAARRIERQNPSDAGVLPEFPPETA